MKLKRNASDTYSVLSEAYGGRIYENVKCLLTGIYGSKRVTCVNHK
jgi:hypothetical protein